MTLRGPATVQQMSLSDSFARAPQNQAPPLQDYNTVTCDRALTGGLAAYASDEQHGSLVQSLAQLGQVAGSAEAREHGMLANANAPVLRTADRFGERIDEVALHPSWHWMLERGVGFGLTASAWLSSDSDAHLRRAAGFIAWSPTEPGHACPLTMTYAAVPALAGDADATAQWGALLASTVYDPGVRASTAKAGVLAGMGMTEKQGGSDVRTNTTSATRAASGTYTLRGHKWFTSAPMNDLFLVLAQAPEGLTCFTVPRVRPDGSRNAIRIVRLKDKLGNRSNASAELEFEDAYAERLGDEGRGVPTIIEMVAATRLDCVLGSAGLMRRAVAEASWHASHRAAFGGILIDKPAMTGVLADLALESEAATSLGLRLAHSVDRRDNEHERAFRRIALPLAKFWVCKRTAPVCVEAMECFGGNGYVEESGMPLLVRESPLNSIWEGSGNVNALDVLRAAQRSPHAVSAWEAEVALAGQAAPDVLAAADDVLLRLRSALSDPSGAEAQARAIAARMAVVLQGALLVRHAPSAVSDAFVASRIVGRDPGVFGALPTSIGPSAIAEIAHRALPS